MLEGAVIVMVLFERAVEGSLEGLMRFGLSAVMVAVFIAALTIPEAFADFEGGLDGSLVLALSYVVVRILHLVLYAHAAGDDQPLRRQVAKMTAAMVLGSTLIITGVVITGPAQTWFWLAGLIVDCGLTFLTSRRGDWRVHSAAHWTERYGLIIILALGESIVAIGVGASQEPVSVPILLGATAGIVLSLGLWWLYFDVTAIAAEHRFAALRGPARASAAVEACTYLHRPLVAGIVLSALGVEDVLVHVQDTDGFGVLGAAVLFGGTVLYLLGNASFWCRVSGEWKTWRLGAATLLLVLIPVAAHIAPLAALALIAVVVFALVAVAVAVAVAVESLHYAQSRTAIRTSP